MFLLKVILTLFISCVTARVALPDEKLTETSSSLKKYVFPSKFISLIDPVITTPSIEINEVTEKTDTNEIDKDNFESSTIENTTKLAIIDINDVIAESINSSEEKHIEQNLLEERPLILTTYIENGEYEEARIASKVDPNLFFGIKSYSGFVTVNKTFNSNLFFWYFPVENENVTETPWIVWLQGGPGASSMTGLFDEIGPFRAYANGTLERNPYTWLQSHSLVFFDNPAGTGFSFTSHKDGYVTNMEAYSSQLYDAVTQFVKIFPELKSAPLYIAGESYAGKYVPSLAMQIHKHRDKGEVNLKGLMMGNAYIDPEMISDLTRPYYYFGLLSKEQLEIVRPLIDGFKRDIDAKDSISAKEKWNSLIVLLLILTNQNHAYNFLKDELSAGAYIKFLTKPEIRKAIHVGSIPFDFINVKVNSALAPDFLSSARPYLEVLLEHYRVLVYCGQLDLMLTCVATSENFRKWQWAGTEKFKKATRHPFIYKGKLSGYHKTGGNLTEVMLRGAGHMAPIDAPAATRDMATRFTHRSSMTYFPLLETMLPSEFARNKSHIFYL